MRAQSATATRARRLGGAPLRTQYASSYDGVSEDRPGSNLMDLEIGLRPVVEGVAGEVRGDLLVEVDVPVADVALEEIGAAGDGEAKRVTGVEASLRWGEARTQGHRRIGVRGWGGPVSMAISHAVLRASPMRRRAGLIVPIDRR